MRRQIRKWFSIVFPLLIGVGVIYYQYTTLQPHEIENIKLSFKKANYNYVYLSLFIAYFGFWSRAYRWKYSLNHLGYNTKFSSNFFTVCISYLVNLTVPRSGEISRAALLKKYESVPFDKGLGTIVAERIVDLFIFFLFALLGFALQFDKLYGFFLEKHISLTSILFAVTIALLLLGVLLLVWIYAKWNIILKIKNKLSGLIEGLSSILKMKKKWKFLFHSFFIWFTYLLMFYVAIFALPETSQIGFDVVIMGFIFGSLAVGFSNGGLGAYPLSIALIFSLYGISNDTGVAFGWLIWTSQTLFTIALGILSYIMLPLVNKNK